MVSYQNTSEIDCGKFAINSHDEKPTNHNVYFSQVPTNCQIPHEVYAPEICIKHEDNLTIAPEFCANESNHHFYNNDDLSVPFYHNIEIPHEVSSPEICVKPEDYLTLPLKFSANENNHHFYNNYHLLAPFYHNIEYTPLTPEPVSYPVFDLQSTQVHQNRSCMAKRHRAQITFVPTSKGNFKTVVKRKRKRTVFTTEQVEALEDIFKTKQYISREERQNIVQNLQLNDKAVKIWFQNRRLKIKRIQSEQCSEESDYTNIRHSLEERSSPDNARLDFVESQINKKTDEFGYVTLDDGVMGDLANVLDDFLTKGPVNDPADAVVRTDSSPIYEPISPASITDSNSEDGSSSRWKPSEPNESLQRLFDLQNMLSL